MYDCSIAIQVLPKVEDEKLIPVVDAVIEYIRSTGLSMYVGPFETTVEGDFDSLMEIIRRSQLICVEKGAPGVMSYVKINYAPGRGVLSIDEKIAKHHQNQG